MFTHSTAFIQERKGSGLSFVISFLLVLLVLFIIWWFSQAICCKSQYAVNR